MLSKPNILVCTDFSESSNLALKAAEVVRSKTNGKLFIIHVCEQLVAWDWLPEGNLFPYNPELEKQFINSLSASMDIQMTNCSVQGEPQILFGVPTTLIAQEIIDKKIDLVVLGHRGQSKNAFNFGSLAQKIIATSNIPALVVKIPFEIENIAILLDPRDPMKKIISWSEECAYLFSSKLSILSIVNDHSRTHIKSIDSGDKDKFKTLDAVKEKIKKNITKYLDAKIRVEFNDERSIAFQLNSMIFEEKVQLVVMRRYHSDFLDKLLIGSETRRMLEIFHGNLFILPP